MTAKRTSLSRKFDSPQQEAYLRIWRLHDRLGMLEDEVFREHGITSQQYNTLRLLKARHPEPMQTLQIARRLVSHAPDITRLLDGLEKKELIRRARSTASRRVVEVWICPPGLELLERLARPLRELHHRQLGHLDPEQVDRLNELLRIAGSPHEPEESPWI
jgi:DNA-binding MarR family transcriptional regulator